MSSPPPHGATKGNSSRWILDAFDRAALEHAFRLDPFPNASMRQQLGNDLNVSPRQIQVWFQNRRQREKLHNPQGRAGPSARPDALTSPEALAGLKQKRDVQDILHMLKDMRPAAQLAQAQMQQQMAQMTQAQAQMLTQATTFRVLAADQPVPEVKPYCAPPHPQVIEPAAHEVALPEPKRARHMEGGMGAPWMPAHPWAQRDGADGLTLLSTGAQSTTPPLIHYRQSTRAPRPPRAFGSPALANALPHVPAQSQRASRAPRTPI